MAGQINFRENKNGFNSINPNSPATTHLPSDRGRINTAYHYVTDGGVPVNRANMIANFPENDLIINGNVFATYETTDILMLDDYRGGTFRDGYLPIRFSDPSRDNLVEEMVTALIPAAHNKPQLRQYIGGALTPMIVQLLDTEGLGDVGRAVLAKSPEGAANMILDPYKEIITINGDPSTATRLEYIGGGQRIRALHFEGANITRLRITVNEQEKWDFKRLSDLNMLLENRGFVPQADTWHVDFEAIPAP